MVKNFSKLKKLHRGDIIKLSFDPVLGHEQKGYRPTLVLSDNIFHVSTGFAFCLPITSKKKGLMFEVEVSGKNIQGVALPHGAKMLDLTARDFIFIEKAKKEESTKAQIILSKIINE